MKNIGFGAACFIPLALLALLSGCANPGAAVPNGTATIRYEQLGACNGYKDGNNVVSAGPDAAFVIFKIIEINNSNGKVNLAYDPTKLFVPPNAHVSTSLSLAQKIGVLGTTAKTVAAGTNLPHNGYAVVAVPTGNSSDPQLEANLVNYFLSYENDPSGPGIILSKVNHAQTKYQGVQNCLSKAW